MCLSNSKQSGTPGKPLPSNFFLCPGLPFCCDRLQCFSSLLELGCQIRGGSIQTVLHSLELCLCRRTGCCSRDVKYALGPSIPTRWRAEAGKTAERVRMHLEPRSELLRATHWRCLWSSSLELLVQEDQQATARLECGRRLFQQLSHKASAFSLCLLLLASRLPVGLAVDEVLLGQSSGCRHLLAATTFQPTRGHLGYRSYDLALSKFPRRRSRPALWPPLGLHHHRRGSTAGRFSKDLLQNQVGSWLLCEGVVLRLLGIIGLSLLLLPPWSNHGHPSLGLCKAKACCLGD
mmetsp:Transcript_79381/g.143262  ORF Transcript_79381/g.143262 Transcript_79381/m.143262 type:complete len:291 (+) Transcript_79381:169-1041(+)